MWMIPGAPERKFHQPEGVALQVSDGTVLVTLEAEDG